MLWSRGGRIFPFALGGCGLSVIPVKVQDWLVSGRHSPLAPRGLKSATPVSLHDPFQTIAPDVLICLRLRRVLRI